MTSFYEVLLKWTPVKKGAIRKFDELYGATTLGIMIFRRMTLTIKGSFMTFSINDTEQNNSVSSAIIMNVVMLSVEFYLLLC
jgi:hypothetical protein